jgi:hypothetical protein
MYVPAYPLPLMEIASFVKFNMPEVEIGIISITVDYGLPLTPDVVFDDDGVFGQNVVRQPSKGLGFEDVVAYMKEIFNLSNNTSKLQKNS